MSFGAGLGCGCPCLLLGRLGWLKSPRTSHLCPVAGLVVSGLGIDGGKTERHDGSFYSDQGRNSMVTSVMASSTTSAMADELTNLVYVLENRKIKSSQK